MHHDNYLLNFLCQSANIAKIPLNYFKKDTNVLREKRKIKNLAMIFPPPVVSEY